MKIAMYNVTTTVKAGGIETFIWEVSKKLALHGYYVDIIGGNGKITHKSLTNLHIYTFPYLPRKFIPNFGTRFKKLIERVSFGLFASWKLVSGKYDIIHIYKPYDFPIAFLVKLFTKTKVCYGSHGTDFFPGDKLFIKYLDKIFACSNFNAQQVKKRYKIMPDTLYNGFDETKFVPGQKSNELLTKFNIKKSEKVIIAINRLIGWKGTDHLIDAFRIVRESVESKLIIIGEGNEKLKLEKKAADFGLKDSIIFTGFVHNELLPDYLNLSDVYVLASVSDETFGITLCEAMGCEKPVISTLVGGIPEVVDDNINGFLVTPRRSDLLAKKIIDLLKDENRRYEMGKKGRQKATENFTWSKIADTLIDKYD